MTPPDDVMTAAIDFFYDEHRNCAKINVSPVQLLTNHSEFD